MEEQYNGNKHSKNKAQPDQWNTILLWETEK